jgi:hypothetical protein
LSQRSSVPSVMSYPIWGMIISFAISASEC